MFRPASLCDQGAQNRFDQILAEAADDATKWFSLQPHERLNVTIHPATRQTASVTPVTNGSITAFSTPSTANQFATITTEFIQGDDAQTVPVDADIILEKKIGGAFAPVAQVQSWALAGGVAPNNLSVTLGLLGRGFYRLRATTVNAPVMLQIEKLPAEETA